ncbi:MAG: hypothetical protein ACXVZ2_00385 [Gaiellaceae bacterium]
MTGAPTESEAHQPAENRRRPTVWASDLITRYPVVIAGALLLLVGLVLLAFVAKVLDLDNGSILVIAFVGPLLAYLILSGQLSEIGGGGFSVKFKEAARKPVEASVQSVTAEATQTIKKLGPEQLGRIAALDLEAPAVLTLTLPPTQGQYEFLPLQQYVSALGRHPRFRFVVFLDADGRVLGYEPHEVLARQLETKTTAEPFIDSVNSGRTLGSSGEPPSQNAP